MKTYCKHVDILSDEHLDYAYTEFSRGNKNRPEFQGFFAIPKQDLFHQVREMVIYRKLELAPITYFKRTEPTNGKTRLIGRASAKQQYLDYVCVKAMGDLFEAKVGYHQCASVKGKGQAHAKRYIERWVRNPKTTVWAKIDIKQFYPSVDREVLFAMLERDIRNPDLVWLIEALVSTHRVGLSIGSYLSQYLANYYLSGAYRYACELARTRRGKRVKLVDHVLVYMDDWLFLGHNKANLRLAVRKVERYIRCKLHLDVKPWKVCRLPDEPIDMVGYVFRRDRTTVRAGIFLRARRAILRAKNITSHVAARIVAYWGYFKRTATRAFQSAQNMGSLMAQCRMTISATR